MRSSILSLSLITVFLGQHPGLVAQFSQEDYLVDRWDTERGLPQNSVTSILQTRDGYLWLSGFGGLVRFDGIRFEVFNLITMPGMRSERVLALFEDRNGALWFGTEGGGAGRLWNDSLRMYGMTEGLPGEVVTSFAEDSGGTLWVGMRDGGLVTIVGDSVSRSPLTDFLPDKGVKSIVFGRDGSLWVCTEALTRFRGDTVAIYYPRRHIPGTQINSIMEDSRQRLWVGTTDGGLVLHTEGRFTTVWPQRETFPENIWRMMEDRKGRLWLSSSRGLYRFEQNRIYGYDKRHGMADLFVRCVFEDREGNLWVGTNTGGLHRFRVPVFQTLSDDDGLLQENITSMALGNEGRVWIGLQCGGVSVWQAGRITNMVGTVINNEGCVWTVFEDSRGYLWVGTWGGPLYRWKKGRLELFGERDGLLSSIVLATYEDTDGTMWFGTLDRGLAKFDGKRFSHFTTDDGLLHNDVRSIRRDRKGNLWIGTAKGVSRFAHGSFTSYTAANGFVDAPVRVIYEDEDGFLWFGTYGKGLVRFADGVFTVFTTKEGMFDNVVSQILEDEAGNFWMGSNRGIARVARKDLNAHAPGRQRLSSAWYERSDGLQGQETNGGFQPAGLKTPDGRLWFPTIRGVAIVDPFVLERNPVPPPVVIQKIVLDGIPQNPGEKVTLNYNHKRVELHFTALSYRAPQKNRFQYYLEGFEDEWINDEHERVVSYTNLPPGNYTFRVRASNDDGVWNMSGASLAIIVTPPLWESWWFRGLVALLFLTVGPTVYVLRVRQLRRETNRQLEFSRQVLQSQERERQRIANELHDSLGQNLLVLKNKILIMDNQEREMSDLVSQTIEEVRNISHNLRPHQLDQLGLTKTLRALVHRIDGSSSVRAKADIDDIDGLLNGDEEINLFRIVQESLNNAIKHARATEIQLTIKKNATAIDLVIEDDGRGLGDSNAGFGLTGMRQRAEMFGWNLNIRSRAGRGTELLLTVPVKATRPGGGER